MTQLFRDKWLRQNTTRMPALALTSATRRLHLHIYYLLRREPAVRPELVESVSRPSRLIL